MVALNIFDVGIEEYVQQQWVQQLTRQIWKQLVTFSDSCLVILFGLICSIVWWRYKRHAFASVVWFVIFLEGGFAFLRSRYFDQKKRRDFPGKISHKCRIKKEKKEKMILLNRQIQIEKKKNSLHAHQQVDSHTVSCE